MSISLFTDIKLSINVWDFKSIHASLIKSFVFKCAQIVPLYEKVFSLKTLADSKLQIIENNFYYTTAYMKYKLEYKKNQSKLFNSQLVVWLGVKIWFVYCCCQHNITSTLWYIKVKSPFLLIGIQQCLTRSDTDLCLWIP